MSRYVEVHVWRAGVQGVVAVAFWLAGTLSAGAQTAPADTPNTESVAAAVGAVCPQLRDLESRTEDQTQLFYRCNRIIFQTGYDTNRDNPYLAVTGEELTAAQSTSIDFSVKQVATISSRLSMFRSAVHGTVAALDSGSVYTLYGDAGGAASGDDDLIGAGRLGVFINGYLGSGSKDVTDFEAGYDVDTSGGTLGIDYRFTDAFVAGAAIGFGKIKADFDNGGNYEGKSTSGSLFASLYGARYYFDSILTYQDQDHDSRRHINYQVEAPPGPPNAPTTDLIDEFARGSTSGDTFGAGLSFGYDFGSGGFRFGPILAISYLDVSVDGFNETGSTTGLNLKYGDQSAESLQLQAGLDAGYAVSTSWGVFYPQARFVYINEQKNDQQNFLLRYVSDPCNCAASDVTSTSFVVTSDKPDDSFFRWGVSLSAVIQNGLSAFIDYDAVASLDTIDYGEFTLGVRYEFR